MKKQHYLLAIILSVTTITAYAVTAPEQEKEAKSVAWYTANVRLARQKNKECFDNTKMQETTDCKNALHALRIIYVGVGN